MGHICLIVALVRHKGHVHVAGSKEIRLFRRGCHVLHADQVWCHLQDAPRLHFWLYQTGDDSEMQYPEPLHLLLPAQDQSVGY
jgi:hypothetical protein